MDKEENLIEQAEKTIERIFSGFSPETVKELEIDPHALRIIVAASIVMADKAEELREQGFVEEAEKLEKPDIDVDSALEFINLYIKERNEIGVLERSGKRKKSDIKQYNSAPTEKFVINNSKVANRMGEGLLEIGDTAAVEVGPKVDVLVSLNYTDEALSIGGKNKFTEYDMAVHNAVCSIYKTGNSFFTPAMVYRVMNGLSDKEKVSAAAEKAVESSIEKSRMTKMTIDFTEQAKKHKYNVQDAKVNDMMLSVKWGSVTFNKNKNVSGYTFNSEPILYTYAKTTKHVITIPVKQLNTKGSLNSTPEVTVMRIYLSKRIELMKNKKNNMHNNKITYESIFNKIEVPEPTVKKRDKIRDHVKKILTALQEQGVIKGFKEYKEGRKVKGVEIHY